jgi:hypothetical protein
MHGTTSVMRAIVHVRACVRADAAFRTGFEPRHADDDRTKDVALIHAATIDAPRNQERRAT